MIKGREVWYLSNYFCNNNKEYNPSQGRSAHNEKKQMIIDQTIFQLQC